MATNDQVIDAFYRGEKKKSGSMTSTGNKLSSYGTVILQREGDRLIGNTTKISNPNHVTLAEDVSKAEAVRIARDFMRKH